MKSLVLVGFAAFSFVGTGAVSMSAIAQSTPRTERAIPQQTSGVLRTTLEREETLYLNKDKTYDYDLVLRAASAIGNQRLPVGTVVRGRFEPAEGGLVYVANSVEIADRILPIRAASELLRDRKDPRQTSTGAILTDAAIGAAGGYLLGEVFGRPDLWKVAGGAAAGVLVGNTTAPAVVIVKPEDAIVLFAN
ncbi:MAG: hypothetical protein DCF25_07780 [Leptolyngbya foveolarum]|uniref:Uncharacterized protein n=1 Tax=Leptolyngbya foveolarum TaxID=47253 RepID=A0A2W4UKI3_9CYAN|nr:MAG: hypothetical protein DCF25_07780 [Leptolyngbya foveolarum]